MADSLREHELIDELLNAYLDGELAQDERSRVRRHLAGCDMCQAELDSLRLTKQAVQALPFLRAPRPFTLEEVTGEVPGAAASPPVPLPSGAEEGDRPVSPPIPDRQPVAPNWAARLGLIWRLSSVAAAACALLFALQMAMLASEPRAAFPRGIDIERPAPGAATTVPQAAATKAQLQGEGQPAGQIAGPAARAHQAPQEGPPVALEQATRSGPQPTPAGAMADAVQVQAPGAQRRGTDSAEQRPVLGGDAGRPLSPFPWPPVPAAAITLSLTGLFGLVALVAFAAERRRRRLLP